MRGLSTEGNLHFKTDWASLMVGNKFTVFALLYFVFEGNFPSQSPRGTYIWRGDITEGFLHYGFRGLIFGGSYTWRGLFFGILRYFSCHFHHRIYYELTITCSPVRLIRSMDRGYQLFRCKVVLIQVVSKQVY